ncbi:MAG: hypothetical protein IPM98_01545 [Lewinellaceae bacterium]|nr:hypothetical protein [Lewinellaceae bacterium]
MSNNSINSLEELLAEKARLRMQIEIVEEELGASAGRTRTELGDFIENKLSIPKQIGQFFQGGSGTGAGPSAIGAIGRAAGLGTWWSGILAALAPMIFNYAQQQIKQRKARKEQPVAGEEAAETTAPAKKKRGFFKRKSDDTSTPAPQ